MRSRPFHGESPAKRKKVHREPESHEEPSDRAIPAGVRKIPTAITVLAKFDENVARARAAVSKMSDTEFRKPWSLLIGGKAVSTMPKLAVYRSSVMSHLIHHRGQLTVFLRLIRAPVPAIYGPSADEPWM